MLLLRSFFVAIPFVGFSTAALTYKGADWSSVPVEEAAGISYKNTAGTAQPFETILKDSGANTVRQRIWVNPSDGNYNLDYNVKLAKRAKAAGLNIYLDLHYADSWADPGKQPTPAAWASQSIDDLSNTIYEYTLNIANTFASEGIDVALMSIGNEITSGLLWPLGKIANSGGAYNTARLLHSAAWGIKDSNWGTKPLIMIHLDNGWKWDTQKWWYDLILSQGPLVASDYDVQGISYYPFYNEAATLASLKTSIANMKSAYGKEVQVVETDWPTYCPNPAYPFPSDIASIPFSPEGQTMFMKNLASTILAAGGTGLFYWEPAWINNANLGSSCGYNLMVDDTGKAMSSLAVFGSI